MVRSPGAVGKCGGGARFSSGQDSHGLHPHAWLKMTELYREEVLERVQTSTHDHRRGG